MDAEQTKKKGSGTERTFIRLSLTSLLTLVFLSLAAMSLAYIGGVMSGRQSCPVPERKMADSLPVREEGENSKDTVHEVLTASELNFARELRGEGNQVAKMEKSVESAPKEDPGQTQEKKQPLPEEESSKQIVENKALPSPKEIRPENAGEIFDHVFQVGAFRDENSVDNLRQILEGHGLRTVMRKEGKVFVVLVRLRGTRERAEEIVTLAHSLGLGEPIQRSRQPVKN